MPSPLTCTGARKAAETLATIEEGEREIYKHGAEGVGVARGSRRTTDPGDDDDDDEVDEELDDDAEELDGDAEQGALRERRRQRLDNYTEALIAEETTTELKFLKPDAEYACAPAPTLPPPHLPTDLATTML